MDTERGVIMSEKRILILLAPGYEELEAVAVIDILRRAGLQVIAAGTVSGPVPSARDVMIVPDKTLDEVMDERFDLIVLPGGLDATESLANDARVIDLLKKQIGGGRFVGAICAAPTILDRHGLARDKIVTCHPVCRASIKEARLAEDQVVQDGLLITSQGPGTAIEFGLKLVDLLAGREKMQEVGHGLLAEVG